MLIVKSPNGSSISNSFKKVPAPWVEWLCLECVLVIFMVEWKFPRWSFHSKMRCLRNSFLFWGINFLCLVTTVVEFLFPCDFVIERHWLVFINKKPMCTNHFCESKCTHQPCHTTFDVFFHKMHSVMFSKIMAQSSWADNALNVNNWCLIKWQCKENANWHITLDFHWNIMWHAK